ncbi:MAG: YcgL domain-containing protein [Dokdonella sp.]
MRCFIYKSSRKDGAYVFLRERDDFTRLPREIVEPLGRLSFAMEMELTPERKLAREDAEVVMEHLDRLGFHLQLPPPDISARRMPPVFGPT